MQNTTLNGMKPKDTILQELAIINQPLGAVSTLGSNSQPQSASVYYVSDSDLNFYFLTRTESRKYENIVKNPRVAFVVTSERPPKTIQIEGTASQMVDEIEADGMYTKLVSQAIESSLIPPISQLREGAVVFMKITPVWIRCGDFTLLKEGDVFVEMKPGQADLMPLSE
jgi:general stress protein 26